MTKRYVEEGGTDEKRKRRKEKNKKKKRERRSYNNKKNSYLLVSHNIQVLSIQGSFQKGFQLHYSIYYVTISPCLDLIQSNLSSNISIMPLSVCTTRVLLINSNCIWFHSTSLHESISFPFFFLCINIQLLIMPYFCF